MMKGLIISLLIIFTILLVLGCIKENSNSEFCELPTKTGISDDNTYTQSILPFKRMVLSTTDGNREYCVHVPASYNEGTSIPVVFAFHGGGGRWFSSVSESHTDLYSEQFGFIVVAADAGENKRWNVGKRDIEGRNSSIDDVNFVSNVIDDLATKYSIDKTKIYAQGLSNGGMMSYHLACTLSEKITAIAAFDSALMDLSYYGNKDCAPSRAIPVIIFHGTKDRLIPIEGGESDPTLPPGVSGGEDFLPTKTSVDFWIKNNNCNTQGNIIYQNGEVTCTEYSGCENNASVKYCIIENGGHVVPGGTYGYGPSIGIKVLSDIYKSAVGHITSDINGTEYAWNFFNQYQITN